MKALIERQLYRPGVVLPLMGLIRLLVTTDFSLTQTGFVIFIRGSRQALTYVSKAPIGAVRKHIGQQIGKHFSRGSSRKQPSAAAVANDTSRCAGCHCGC